MSENTHLTTLPYLSVSSYDIAKELAYYDKASATYRYDEERTSAQVNEAILEHIVLCLLNQTRLPKQLFGSAAPSNWTRAKGGAIDIKAVNDTGIASDYIEVKPSGGPGSGWKWKKQEYIFPERYPQGFCLITDRYSKDRLYEKWFSLHWPKYYKHVIVHTYGEIATHLKKLTNKPISIEFVKEI